MVDFHGSRLDKSKPNATLDIINDFIRIMEPLKDEIEYWLEFFIDRKESINAKSEVNNQVNFFDNGLTND